MGHLQRIDSLLRAIFPEEVLPELTREGTIRPRRYEKVGVCFVDASSLGPDSLTTCIDDTTGAYFRPHPRGRVLLGVPTEVPDLGYRARE